MIKDQLNIKSKVLTLTEKKQISKRIWTISFSEEEWNLFPEDSQRKKLNLLNNNRLSQ